MMKYAAIFLSCLMLLACTPSSNPPSTANLADPGFIHSVYFYLNEETDEAQIQQLINDCKTLLGAVETVRQLYVGLPAGTPRDVVDNSYGVNLLVYFDDKAGHDYYQTSEKHLQFIERNQNAWSRVQVYDMLPQ